VSRLTLSKRITPKFEVVFSQSLSESDDLAWVLVWRPGGRAMDLRATVRTNGAEADEFRQELEFGGTRPGAGESRRSRPPAPQVARVDIDGLPADEEASVYELLSLRAGGSFTTDAWQRDRQAIAAYFHRRDRLRVRVRARHTVAADGMYQLAYEITPGPITRFEINGYDASGNAEAALRDAWSRVVVEDLVAEELTDVLRAELARKGHLSAEVNTRLRSLAEGGRLAVIDVVPGTRTRRRSIVFTGNAAVPAADLRAAIATSLEPRGWLVPSVVEEPVAAVYRRRGYLAARATAARALEKDRATLTVRVEEGARFTVGDMTLSGTTSLGPEAARAGAGLVAGAPFTDDVLAAAVASLRTAYARAGYLAADVVSSVAVKPEKAVVDVAMTVTEGPRSVLREVRFAGAEETSRELVARTLGVEAGGSVDMVALDEGQQRLYQTGIFRRVDVDVIPLERDAGDAGEAAHPVQAIVRLEERARYRLRYGVQFGPSTIDSITTARNTADPGATLDLQRRNINGLGIVAGGGGVWSGEQHRVRGTVSAARLRNRAVSTTVTVENANQDRASDDGLNIVDRGTSAVVEQRWRFSGRGRIELAYGFDLDNRRLELRATTQEALPLHGRFAGLYTTFTYDSRDNRFNPRRGTFHTSRIDAGAGLWLSDVAFGRYQVQHFVYRPAGTVTLASGVRAGLLDVDDARQPASLLLYFTTGGATTVRGYESDALTSGYVLGLPVGGKVLLVLNQEARVPLTRRLGVVGFVDAGNTFTGLDTFSLGGLKLGVGGGVRLDTPVAVLRLDIGIPLPRQPAGPRARWYASIGQAF
jgi:outer membrane protein assembly factor BamA